MNVKKLFFVACHLFGVLSFAQVGINTTTPNALLDIRATSATAPTNTDGLLIPKVDVFPATNPTAAQQGMLLYLTTTSGSNAPGFYYWDNPTTTWIGLGKDAKAWQLSGNTVNAATDFMGSTNDADVIFRRNNVRAGRLGANNVSLGVGALNTATTGSWNAAVGGNSLLSNTTGSSNTAVGDDASRGNTTGGFNTAVGSRALRNNATGNDNTGLGYNTQTGTNLTNATAIGANASATTSNSLVLGSISGTNGATASAKVGIGTTAPNAALEIKAINPAAPTNTEGLLIPRINVFPATNPTAAQHGMQVFLTTAVGTQQPGFYYWNNPTTSWVGIGGSATGSNWALTGNTVNAATDFMGSTNDADVIFKRNNVRAGRIGADNTSFGVNALNPAATGAENLALGFSALRSNTSGFQNTALGSNALLSNTTGYENTATGLNALRANTSGRWLTANGAYSLNANTTGVENAAFGVWTLQNNVTGQQNTAVGAGALRNNTIGSNNVGIGYLALNSNAASNNVAVGSAALQNNTTGNYNTAMGYSALRVTTTSNWNQAIGYQGLEFNTTGVSNTSNGGQTLHYNSSGSWNTASGGGALGWNTTGYSNTAVGFWALGNNVSGYGNTALGRESFSSNANYNNSTALGYLCQVTASNQVRIGNNAVTSIGGQVGWTTLSDARFKTESNQKVPGIDFIKKLRPITYFVNHEVVNNFLETNVVKSLNGRKGLGADASTQIAKRAIPEKTLESGFMAQEVEQAAKELGYEFNGVDAPKNEKDYYGLRYSQFVVPLVKAVQELNEKLEQKDAMLLELEKRIAKLEKNASN